MLFIVATPIGNLGDLSSRAADTLRKVQTVLAEDTRVTRKLLAHLDAHPDLERFDEHTAYAKTPALVKRLQKGEHIALVSDAGTPTISDPGAVLIDAVREAGLAITIIPGPSAVVAALVASGFPADSFYFGGFLPRKEKAQRDALDALVDLDTTLVFYESPRRLVRTLETCAAVLADERHGAVARELTKVHEEVVRGSLRELAREFSAREGIKGEIVLIVAPPAKQPNTRVHIDKYGDKANDRG